MTQLVVVVPAVIEPLVEQVADRHFRIRVVTADHQDDAVDEYQHVGQ